MNSLFYFFYRSFIKPFLGLIWFAEEDTIYAKQFQNNVMMLSQQRGSKLRNKVMLKTGVVGEDVYFDQIGKVSAVKRTARNQDTPNIQVDYYRRRASLQTIEFGHLLDKRDAIRTLADPTSVITQSAYFALGRSIDTELCTAYFADAATGKAGGSTTSFTAGNQIPVASTGMTLAKLITAREMLDNNDVPDDEERFIVCTPDQISDLLNDTKLPSGDYSTVLALVEGKILHYMGFNFVRMKKGILPVNSSNYRRCMAYAKNGLGLAIGADINVDISTRNDKGNAKQVFATMDIAATRIDEERCVEIICQE